jgi:hypothetical protein
MTCCPDKRTLNKGVHLVIVPDRVGQSGLILKSLLFSTLSPYLQNTPGLSGTVAHLGLSHSYVRWDRLASGPVVVSLGGQRSPRLAGNHLTRNHREDMVAFL